MTSEEKKNYCLSMANTIWNSLFCSITLPVAMSWGIKEKTATYYKDMPALKIQVNGLVHKGTVIVAYNEGSDFFDAFFFDKRNQCIKTIEDICFDELGLRLDENIERPKSMSKEQYKAESWVDTINNIVHHV